MVKKDTILTPCFISSIISLLFFYVFLALFNLSQSFILLLIIVLLHAGVITYFQFFAYQKLNKTYFLSISFGLLVAFISWHSVMLTKKPIDTLGDITKIVCVQGLLDTDPQPYGENNYRVAVSVKNFLTQDGSQFSGKGKLSVLIPSILVEQLYPNKLSVNNTKSLLFSAHIPLSLYGKYIKTKNEESLFIVDRAESFVTSSFFEKIPSFRASLRLSLMRILSNWGDAGGFLLALTSGERVFLAKDLADDFKRTGLSHILALSGMHLSLVGLVAAFAGKKMGGIRLSKYLVLFSAIIFVWFAGFTPSLNRALLMVLCAFFAKSLGLSPSTLSILATTVLCQMLLFPVDATSLAFMLSYGALAGILVLGGPLAHLLETKLPKGLTSDLIASIGAQIATIPILAIFIGCISPIGLIASVFITPIANIFMVLGSFFALISFILPPLEGLCSFTIKTIYFLIQKEVSFFSLCSPLQIQGAIATIFGVLLPIIIGYIILFLFYKSKRWRASDDCFAQL